MLCARCLFRLTQPSRLAHQPEQPHAATALQVLHSARSIDPAQASVGVLMTIGAFPWVIKPVYGFLSDSVPLLGYKRRSYLVVCGLLGETLHLQPHSVHGKAPQVASRKVYVGSAEGASSMVSGVVQLPCCSALT